jgi:hypothetical protein
MRQTICEKPQSENNHYNKHTVLIVTLYETHCVSRQTPYGLYYIYIVHKNVFVGECIVNVVHWLFPPLRCLYVYAFVFACFCLTGILQGL